MVKLKTIERRNNLFERIFKAGITVEQARKFNVKEWNDFFDTNIGYKIKKMDISQKEKDLKLEVSLKAQKRLLKQIQNNKDIQLEYYFKEQNIKNSRVIDFTKNEFDNIFLETKVILETIELGKLDEIDYPKRLTKEYGVVEVIHESGQKTFIKFDDNESLERQLNILKRNYGKIISIEFSGVYPYTQYLSKEFTDLLGMI